ncbi:MAG: Calx-beta domain-containing protein [Gammaproteobacteria bacterium]
MITTKRPWWQCGWTLIFALLMNPAVRAATPILVGNESNSLGLGAAVCEVDDPAGSTLAGVMPESCAAGLVAGDSLAKIGCNPISFTTALDATAPAANPDYVATTGTQTGRLLRNGVASSCAVPKANPGLNDATVVRRYDAYVITPSQSGCVTFTLTQPTTTLFFYAVSNFVPATPGVNYLADAGASAATTSFSMNVTAGQPFTLVVHEVNANGGLNTTYSINVSGVCTGGPPAVASSGGVTAFVEGGGGVAVDAALTVTDPDDTTLASGAVSISANFQTAEDVLVFTNDGATMGNIAGSFDSGTGVLSLTSAGATATLAEWQAALRAVQYNNSSDTPNIADRTVSFMVNDGVNDSAPATQTVSVTPVNDPPTIAAPGPFGVTEDVLSPLTGLAFADPDAGVATVTVTLAVGAGNGVLVAADSGGVTVGGANSNTLTLTGTLAAINAFIAAGNVGFQTSPNATSDVTLTVGIDDGGNTGTGGAQAASTSVTLIVAAVNDPPTLTVPATLTGIVGVASAVTGVAVADLDVGAGTLTMTFSAPSGAFSAASGGGVTVGGTAAALTLTGDLASLNAYLAANSLSYQAAVGGVIPLTLSVNDNGNTGSGGPQSGAGGITFNASVATTFAIDDVSVTEGNGGTVNLVFTVTRTLPAGTQAVTVATIAGGTATAGTDFVSLPATTLTFTGAQATQTVNVVVNGDAVDESNETVFVRLSNATGGATISAADGVGTIIDDDNAQLTVSDVTVNENAGAAIFTITLNIVVQGGLTLGFATANGTATAGADFTASTGTLTFAGTAGEVQTVTVPINDDAIDEADETLFVDFGPISNTAVGFDSQASGVITDNDGAGITVTPSSGLTTTEAGGTATFTVVLNSQPSANVSIALASSDTSEGTVSPASLTFTPANFGTAQTVTVTGVDDAAVDGDIAYQIITAQAVSTDATYAAINPPDVAVTNTDDDSAGALLDTTMIVNGSFLPASLNTYTVTIVNQGDGDQPDNPGNEFVLVLPASLELQSANFKASGALSADLDTNTVTWNGPLAAKASVVFDIVARLKPNVIPGTEVSVQGQFSYDSDGDGVNDVSGLTDDPATSPTDDATLFTVLAAAIPTLSFGALLLLVLGLWLGAVSLGGGSQLQWVRGQRGPRSG